MTATMEETLPDGLYRNGSGNRYHILRVTTENQAHVRASTTRLSERSTRVGHFVLRPEGQPEWQTYAADDINLRRNYTLIEAAERAFVEGLYRNNDLGDRYFIRQVTAANQAEIRANSSLGEDSTEVGHYVFRPESQAVWSTHTGPGTGGEYIARNYTLIEETLSVFGVERRREFWNLYREHLRAHERNGDWAGPESCPEQNGYPRLAEETERHSLNQWVAAIEAALAGTAPVDPETVADTESPVSVRDEDRREMAVRGVTAQRGRWARIEGFLSNPGTDRNLTWQTLLNHFSMPRDSMEGLPLHEIAQEWAADITTALNVGYQPWDSGAQARRATWEWVVRKLEDPAHWCTDGTRTFLQNLGLPRVLTIEEYPAPVQWVYEPSVETWIERVRTEVERHRRGSRELLNFLERGRPISAEAVADVSVGEVPVAAGAVGDHNVYGYLVPIRYTDAILARHAIVGNRSVASICREAGWTGDYRSTRTAESRVASPDGDWGDERTGSFMTVLRRQHEAWTAAHPTSYNVYGFIVPAEYTDAILAEYDLQPNSPVRSLCTRGGWHENYSTTRTTESRAAAPAGTDNWQSSTRLFMQELRRLRNQTVTPTDGPSSQALADLQGQVTQLTAERDAANAALETERTSHNDTRTARTRFARQVREVLIEIQDDESISDETMNGWLGRLDLELIETEYEVTIVVDATCTRTYTVMATDEDAARDAAYDEYSDDSLAGVDWEIQDSNITDVDTV